MIPGDVVMHDKPQGRGYVQLRETAQAPWPGPTPDTVIAAHEFHYSSLDGLQGEPVYAYDVLRGAGIDGRHDGLVVHNLLACYSHMRDTARHHWAQRFVTFVRRCRASGKHRKNV
jgi:cobyrinic acid a,c-diamide synthase